MKYDIYKLDCYTFIIKDDGIGICEITLFNQNSITNNDIQEETDSITLAKTQLSEYFNGVRKSFDFPMNPHGTPFQKKVWKELTLIPYGECRNYQDIAIKIDCPKGARAIGMANNKNPIIIAIPCHRVIGKNGSLVGYALGLDMKKQLLTLEGYKI